MAAVVQNNILQLTTVCNLNSQYGLNVSHWLVTSPGVPVIDDSVIASFFVQLLGPLYKACLANTASWVGVRVQVRSPVAFDAVADKTNAGPGTAGPEALPTQTAGLIRLRTGTAGKAFRGRKYIPFPAEAVNDTHGKPTLAHQINLAAIAIEYASVQNVMFGGQQTDLEPVLWRQGRLTPAVIKSYSVQTEWATMRTRSQINRGDAAPI